MKSHLIIIIILIFVSISPVFAKYSGGTGEPNDPWQISCPNDLLYLGNHPEDYNSCFILTADIDLAGYAFTTAVIAPVIYDSNGEFSGAKFTGIFDGNDFVIRNLTIDSNGTRNSFLGVFGRTDSDCQIKNLGVEDVNITSGKTTQNIGGLAGSNCGKISNCYTAGYVRGGMMVSADCAEVMDGLIIIAA